jgi:hypothetical protein
MRLDSVQRERDCRGLILPVKGERKKSWLVAVLRTDRLRLPAMKSVSGSGGDATQLSLIGQKC